MLLGLLAPTPGEVESPLQKGFREVFIGLPRREPHPPPERGLTLQAPFALIQMKMPGYGLEA